MFLEVCSGSNDSAFWVIVKAAVSQVIVYVLCLALKRATNTKAGRKNILLQRYHINYKNASCLLYN